MADEPNENHIKIDPERCKGCGVCIRVCPKHCIVKGSDINKMGYQYSRFEQHKCTACGVCFHCCPEFGAITVYKKK